jgi:hypothetical protein
MVSAGALNDWWCCIFWRGRIIYQWLFEGKRHVNRHRAKSSTKLLLGWERWASLHEEIETLNISVERSVPEKPAVI